MFENYPKTRPILPDKILDIYNEHYISNRNGSTPASFLSMKMESWMHRRVAEDVIDGSQNNNIPTLEIGAGNLNQLDYEKGCFPYDIVEPFRELYNGKSNLKKIRNIYSDINEVPIERKYKRITSIATFEHICNLPAVVATCTQLLDKNGNVRVAIPSEGTFLWKLGWQLTTGIEFRIRYGINYKEIIEYEHVNSAIEVERVLRYFFKNVSSSFFGFTRNVSFYQFFNCSSPNNANYKNYIKLN